MECYKDRPLAAAVRAAFPHTIPVLAGFTFLGIAYGILMQSKGYGLGWTVLMSTVVFAGSAQYMAITLLTAAFNPVGALVLTLMVNARHLFYGISMLERFRGLGRLKGYLIFALCDETFSILCAAEPPPGVDRGRFMLCVAALDHFYWVMGSVIGALMGAVLAFNTKGLDFVLTALFVVILLGHWKQRKNRLPAVVGLACSVLCLIVFGPGNFIIPAMVAILAALTLGQKSLAKGERP